MPIPSTKKKPVQPVKKSGIPTTKRKGIPTTKKSGIPSTKKTGIPSTKKGSFSKMKVKDVNELVITHGVDVKAIKSMIEEITAEFKGVSMGSVALGQVLIKKINNMYPDDFKEYVAQHSKSEALKKQEEIEEDVYFEEEVDAQIEADVAPESTEDKTPVNHAKEMTTVSSVPASKIPASRLNKVVKSLCKVPEPGISKKDAKLEETKQQMHDFDREKCFMKAQHHLRLSLQAKSTDESFAQWKKHKWFESQVVNEQCRINMVMHEDLLEMHKEKKQMHRELMEFDKKSHDGRMKSLIKVNEDLRKRNNEHKSNLSKFQDLVKDKNVEIDCLENQITMINADAAVEPEVDSNPYHIENECMSCKKPAIVSLETGCCKKCDDSLPEIKKPVKKSSKKKKSTKKKSSRYS